MFKRGGKEMKVHVIVDFSYMYYKYKFSLESGRLRRFSANVDVNGTNMTRDISIVYYTMSEIEGIRRGFIKQGHDVTLSICFDMPSIVRKQLADNGDSNSDYKGGRKKSLDESDFSDIRWIQRILTEAGHNTYRVEGVEADDLVRHLVVNTKDKFDYTIIYTSDKDLLINVDDTVNVMRHKSGKKSELVTKENFTDYLRNEFGCIIPFNSIMLFLATKGDVSDHIKGIAGFGPAAYQKYAEWLWNRGIDFTRMIDYAYVVDVINESGEYLKPNQMEQALESLSLVRPMDLSGSNIEITFNVSTEEKRKQAYLPLNMTSLIE